MPNRNDKTPGNVEGKFYVDTTCIDCDLCREIAPTIFSRNAEVGLSFVFRQPETAEELQQTEEAMSGCPCECIGNDG